MINCNKCGKPWDGHATACEPIKRYVMIGNAWTSQEHASGMWMLYHNHLAALESARAEAFRMGQEDMKQQAIEATTKHTKLVGAPENQDFIGAIVRRVDRVIESLRAIPLKDKP